MHSNIIQVGTEPIPEENYICESDPKGYFVGRIADYVSDVVPKEVPEIAKSIFSRNEIFDLDLEKMTVTIKDKKKYFEKKFEYFISRLKVICEKATLETFTSCEPGDNGLRVNLQLCNEAYNLTHDFYVYEEDVDDHPVTLDEWVRRAEDKDKFYIGGAVNYHC
jgi:hypothetical protein